VGITAFGAMRRFLHYFLLFLFFFFWYIWSHFEGYLDGMPKGYFMGFSS
jgi:hypothetical protein